MFFVYESKLPFSFRTKLHEYLVKDKSQPLEYNGKITIGANPSVNNAVVLRVALHESKKEKFVEWFDKLTAELQTNG